jgi:hypothetical protein
VASYYFGNLSYPSHDRPRLGLLSTVPENAGDLLRAAVLAAKQANNNFPGECHSFRHVVCMCADNYDLHGNEAVSHPAPSGVPNPTHASSHVGPSSTVGAALSGDSILSITLWSWSAVFITITFIISGPSASI